MNSAELAAHLIERSKNLKKFEIKRELPDGFLLQGIVPFDLRINKNRIICSVYALTEDEANTIVTKFLENNKEDDE